MKQTGLDTYGEAGARVTLFFQIFVLELVVNHSRKPHGTNGVGTNAVENEPLGSQQRSIESSFEIYVCVHQVPMRPKRA